MPRQVHYVHVNVRIPTTLSDEQRRIYEELAGLEGEELPERGMLDKMKDFFAG